MSAADRLLPRLHAVRPIGDDRWIARCPAHEDRRPSLTIRRTADRVLVHCWAGCTYQDILAALNIGSGSALFDDDRHKPNPEAWKQKAAADIIRRWLTAEQIRVSRELRARDYFAGEVHDAVRGGAMTEGEAWESLALAYVGYSELEYYYERLRTEDPVTLWRAAHKRGAAA